MHRRGFNVSLKIRAAQPTKNAFPFEGKVSAEPVKPEAIRIPKEQPAPVSEPTPADSGNTQVFNFIKDEI